MYSLLLCNIYVNGYYLLSLLNANKSHVVIYVGCYLFSFLYNSNRFLNQLKGFLVLDDSM